MQTAAIMIRKPANIIIIMATPPTSIQTAFAHMVMTIKQIVAQYNQVKKNGSNRQNHRFNITITKAI